jgi:TPP-dependent pyruvate/acetoin dehydrogenase alpha subunit
MELITARMLDAFEDKICKAINMGIVMGPVHLRSGNAPILVELFKCIQRNDWVFATWANHQEYLLKGVPEKELYDQIVAGNSMWFSPPEHKCFASAIVGGILPIALGTAMGLRLSGAQDHVYCFVGDMAALTGSFFEAWYYASNHHLPITFVIADNGLSVTTDTRKAWGITGDHFWADLACVQSECEAIRRGRNIVYYRYANGYCHSGVTRAGF